MSYRLVITALVTVGCPAQAGTIFIDDDNCPGPGSGSEDAPYCSIQDAIDAAVDADELVVGPGTYFEAINFLGKAIALRSTDGPQATTIDATGLSISAVTCATGERLNTVLDGFTIRGGGGPFGGGMYLGSSATVTNCAFRQCNATRGGGLYAIGSAAVISDCTFVENTAQWGAGLYTVESGGLSLTGCVVAGNTAGYGGGMFNDHSDPTITSCTFTSNRATGGGGGGMTNSLSDPTVSNCTFAGNSTSNPFYGYGGGMLNSTSSPTVTNCAFSGNDSAARGGGISNAYFGTNPTVVNCAFSGNAAGTGGGLSNYFNESGTTTNCIFVGNTSSGSYGGGGIANFMSENPTVAGCTFFGNSAGSGGAVASFLSSPTISNCIVWENIPNGNAIAGGTPAVSYSNVQQGFAGTGNIEADPMFVDPDSGDFRLTPGSPCIDAGDNSAAPADAADLDADGDTAEPTPFDAAGHPRFLEIPETPDCPQAPGSCGALPVVDMGAYEALGGCLAVTSLTVVCHDDGVAFTVSIEGLVACGGGTTAVTFTGSGGAIGEEACFMALVGDGGFCCSTEVCVTVPDCSQAFQTCDLDGDDAVGVADFLALLSAWGPCTDCGNCPADFDADCAVGIADLLELLGNWNS